MTPTNGKLRDELLDQEVFDTLQEALVLIASWRQHYNGFRPRSALDWAVSSRRSAKLKAGGGRLQEPPVPDRGSR
jgi:transposase InsO family protein